MEPPSDRPLAPPTKSHADLILFRPKSPVVALGLAVEYLMTKPAFANLRFGDWSRILVGQINRRHYYFVIDAAKQVQGFLGWAVTTRDKAEAWAEGRGGLSNDGSSSGDCIIFNAWAASSAPVNRWLLDAARTVMMGKETIYFKRHYRDGSIRPVRLSVNQFVAEHIKRNSTS